MTDDHDSDHTIDNYDTVTARDITEFLYDYADLHCSARGDDPAEQAAFLDRKADLFTYTRPGAVTPKVKLKVNFATRRSQRPRSASPPG